MTLSCTTRQPKTRIRRVQEKNTAHVNTWCGPHISYNSSVNCTHDSFSNVNGSLMLMNTDVIKTVIFSRRSVTNVHIVLQICSGRTNTDVRTAGLGYRLGSEPWTPPHIRSDNTWFTVYLSMYLKQLDPLTYTLFRPFDWMSSSYSSFLNRSICHCIPLTSAISSSGNYQRFT